MSAARRHPGSLARAIGHCGLIACAPLALSILLVSGCEPGPAPTPAPTTAPVGAPIQSGPADGLTSQSVSASQPAASASAPIGVPDRDRPGYVGVSFKELSSFAFDPLGISVSPADLDPYVLAALGEKREFKIPDNVKALDGKKASITGYILPIQVDVYRNESKSFMLVRDRIFCCFGATAGYGDFVMVEMVEGKAAKIMKDVPATALGVLSVGEEKDRSGIILNIYRMKCEELTYAPPK